jgi:hypothetical protein
VHAARVVEADAARQVRLDLFIPNDAPGPGNKPNDKGTPRLDDKVGAGSDSDASSEGLSTKIKVRERKIQWRKKKR